MTVREAAPLAMTIREGRKHGSPITGSGKVNVKCIAPPALEPFAGKPGCMEVDASVTFGDGEIPMLLNTYSASVGEVELFGSVEFYYKIVPTSSGGNSGLRILYVGAISTGGFVTSFHHMTVQIENDGAGNGKLAVYDGPNTTDTTKRKYYADFAQTTAAVFEWRVVLLSSLFSYCQLKKDGTLIASFLHNRQEGLGDGGNKLNGVSYGMTTGATAIGSKGYYINHWLNDTDETLTDVNSGWPGTLTFTHLPPTGAGANLAYTLWANDWQAIDEAPTVDGASERIQTGTLDRREGWSYGTTTLAGTFRCLSFPYDWQRFVNSGAPVDVKIKFMTWMDGVENDSAEYQWEVEGETTFGTGAKGQCFLFEKTPAGNTITQTEVDNLEGGVWQTSATSGTFPRVYAHRVCVIEGTPGPAGDPVAAPAERTVMRGAMRGVMRGVR